MLNFELPLVRSNIRIHDAFADIIESKTSGLLFDAGAGDLRLLHFKDMLEVADDKLLIREVKFKPVVDVISIAQARRLSHLLDLGSYFGFVGQGPEGARLFSVEEPYGLPYTLASGGLRCSRPGRPPATPARKWYHYCPPHVLDQVTPSTCKFCGASIP
jgi:hypothetical protein